MPIAADHRIDAAMAASRTIRPDPQRLPGQIQFVVNQENLLRRNLVLHQQTLHRLAAHIHVRLRFGQQNSACLPINPWPTSAIESLRVTWIPVAFRQPVDNQESKIVRRELVFRPGISEPDNQPVDGVGHVASSKQRPQGKFYFFFFSLGGRFFFLLALLDDFGFGSSRGSCRNGSAAAGVSSALSATTCASTWSGGLTSFIDLRKRDVDPARRFWPIINSLTSTVK